MRRWLPFAAGVAVVAVIGAGCSSNSSPSSTAGTTGSGGTKSITIGVLTDLTGEAASGNKTSVQGVRAGAVLAAKDGYKIHYVVGDTTTSPSGALQAAQKLVTQDHVTAIVAVSALTFGAANYLTQQGIPVVGAPEDGPEWVTSKNMFPVYGYLDATKVSTTYGAFFKKEGVKNVGVLGYGVSPQSADAAKGAAISAQHAGLTAGYQNTNFPFGSTNVEPVAIAMKSAGVEGVVPTVDPNTGFALITALRQLNHNPKVPLLPTGYGGDLLQAGPSALQTAKGVYFDLSFEPVEMHTAATEQFQNSLKAAGVHTEPTYGEYAGYTSVALLIEGLKAAGASPTSASLITALGGVKNFNAAGLLGSHSFDLSDRGGTAIGVDGCLYVTKFSGSKFELVPGADPICGTEIQGKSAATS